MGVSGIAAYAAMTPAYSVAATPRAQSAQSLQPVQSIVAVEMLGKVMDQDQIAAIGLMREGMPDANVKAAELSVNPHIGSMFDVRV